MTMKIFLLTILSAFFFGCSVAPLNLRTDKADQDAFKKESFLRYSHGRLGELQKTAYKALGKCHKGKAQDGLEMLKKEALAHKQRPDYWNQVGLCYLISRNYIKAAFYFDLSMKKSPKGFYAPALNNMGVLYLRLGHHQRALDTFKEITSKGKSSLEVPQFNLSQLYLRFHLLASAKKILEKLHRRNNQDIEVIYSLASLALLQGELSKAHKLFESIPQDQRKREDITLGRALVFYQQKKYEKALEVLKQQKFGSLASLKNSAEKLKELIKNRLEEQELEIKKAKLVAEEHQTMDVKDGDHVKQ